MFTSATCLGCLLRMRQFSLIYRPYDADLLHLPHTYCACANADFLYLQNRWCWPPSSATCFCSLRMRQCWFSLFTEQMLLNLFICHMFGMLTAHALMLIFLLFTEQMMLTFFICQMFGMFGAHASMLILFYLQNRWCWPSSSATCSGCPAHARTLSSMAFSTTTLPREGGNKQ